MQAARERFDRRRHQRHLHEGGRRILVEAGALPAERIMGVETGGCPHTAIREDASINLAAIADMRKRFPDLDVILIESGGDNLAATFSPRARRPHDLCHRCVGRRKNSAQRRSRHHPLGPSGHQQDRPRSLRRRLPRGDGARRQAHARRAAVRLQLTLRTGDGGRFSCHRAFHRGERRFGNGSNRSCTQRVLLGKARAE